MADYKKALQAGLNADAVAEAARAEIATVVGELSAQVKEATDGEVEVQLGKNTKQSVRYLTGLVASVTGREKEIDTVKYTAIFAVRLGEGGGREELAELEISPEGYPVYLTGPNVTTHAHDRASLEAGIEKLLSHPDTGGKIRLLRARKQKASPTT